MRSQLLRTDLHDMTPCCSKGGNQSKQERDEWYAADLLEIICHLAGETLTPYVTEFNLIVIPNTTILNQSYGKLRIQPPGKKQDDICLSCMASFTGERLNYLG